MKRNEQPALFQATETPAPRTPHPTQPGHLPAWIADQLQANQSNRTRRTAKYQYCDKCGDITLTGLDHDTAAFTATTDPTPLTTQTEMLAILTDRTTYDAWRIPDGYKLELRDQTNMGDRTHPILPAHKCGHRFPGFLEPPTHGDHHEWRTPDF